MSSLKWYQWSLFVYMYIGYMLYYFNRKTFSFIMPTAIEANEIDTTAVGSILSSFASAYAIGKFVSGILADKVSLRFMFCFGLFLSGATTFAFGYAPPSYFSLLWFCNGLAQGPGWPACAKLLRRWYPSNIFGTMWSTLSTSMNLSVSVGPVACAFLISANGGQWRPVMYISGILSSAFAVICLFTLIDKPEDVGISGNSIHGDKSVEKTEQNHPERNDTPTKTIWNRIFTSSYTYVISFGYLTSTLIKTVLSEWGALYLIQEKHGNTYSSGLFISSMEVGGIVGSIASGYFSDLLVKYIGVKTKGHPRHAWLLLCEVVLVASVSTLVTLVYNVDEQQSLVLALAFLIGFTSYGIISLVGVLVIENSANDISGTAHAFCALLGNLGMMAAGLPFSVVLEYYSWNVAIMTCQVLVTLSAVLFFASEWLNCRIGDLIKQD